MNRMNITGVTNTGGKKQWTKVSVLDHKIKFYFICDKNNNIRTFFCGF